MSTTERLQVAYTGAVFDVLKEMGHPDCTLPHDIRPLDPTLSLVGEVWTCSGVMDPTISADESLLIWTGMLSKAPSGSVVICQPNDSTIAHMGELSAEVLKYRGVRGFIVDGGNRDSDFILRLKFPVFCRYLTPADVTGTWKLDSMGEPITIGGLTISTGDYAVADRDGVVIVPGRLAAEVADRINEVIGTENEVRTLILGGLDPQEAYLKYGRF